jgi:hypothetical protein
MAEPLDAMVQLRGGRVPAVACFGMVLIGKVPVVAGPCVALCVVPETAEPANLLARARYNRPQ